MQTPYRKALTRESNPGPCCYQATALTAAPLCRPSEQETCPSPKTSLQLLSAFTKITKCSIEIIKHSRCTIYSYGNLKAFETTLKGLYIGQHMFCANTRVNEGMETSKQDILRRPNILTLCLKSGSPDRSSCGHLVPILEEHSSK